MAIWGESLWTQGPVWRVFLVAGQSNAMGFGPGSMYHMPRHLAAVWKPGVGLQPVRDPTGYDPNAKGSAWPAFCERMWTRYDTNTVIVNPAVGGSSELVEWSASGSLRAVALSGLSDCLEALDAINRPYEVSGILCSVGEATSLLIEAGEATRQDHIDGLADLFSALRTGIGISDLPVFLGQTGLRVQTGDTPALRAVREAQIQYVANDPDAYMAWTGAKSLLQRGLMTNDAHYKQAGYDEMGAAFADCVAEVLA